MSGSWIAGSVRGRLLAVERRPVAPEGLPVSEAQRRVQEAALLNLRVLAGWLPPEALGLLRALCAWFELVNVEDRAAYLEGAPLRKLFELGSLAVGWPRAAEAQSVEELRAALARSAWGDPGPELGLGLRLAWARRVVSEAPEARSWALGAAALLLAAERFAAGRPVEAAPPALGTAWREAGALEELADALPPEARWPLDGLDAPERLWQGELRWWSVVEREARALLRGPVGSRSVVVGTVAAVACDAHRAAAAAALAARRGLEGAEEGLVA